MRLALSPPKGLARLAPLFIAGLLAAACYGQEEPVATEDIVAQVPFMDGERSEYVLLDRDDEEEVGEGVLTVERQDGELELTLRFVGGGISDESVVVVDAETIKPITVRRERQGEEVEVIEGEYDAAEEIVEVTEIGEEGDERLVPLRLEENSYDNESSLFLWRTIAFEEGYEASYHSVLANFRNTNVVTLNVVGKEQVTVPAGTFDTWRVEIQAGDVDQVAWFTDTPSHVLVQYDNSLQLFKLTEAPEGT